LGEQFDDIPDIVGAKQLDFEKVTHDRGFALAPGEIDFTDFSTILEGSETARDPPPKTDLGKLRKYCEVIRVAEAIASKLSSELAPISANAMAIAATRLEKMTEDNFRLLVRIRDTHTRLERTLADTANIVKKLHSTIKAHNAHCQNYISLLKNFRTLIHTHSIVDRFQNENRFLTAALISFCLSLGRFLFTKADTDITKYLHSIINSAIQLYIELHPKPIIEDPPPSDRRDPDPTILDPLALLKSLARKPKRTKRTRREITSAGLPSKCAVDLFARRARTSDEYLPAEIAHLIFLVAKIGDVKDVYTVFHGAMRDALQGMLRSIGAELGDRERDISRQIAMLNQVGHTLLIRGKCAMAVQTESILKVSVETMATGPPQSEPTRSKKK
jgi:hypothetical protein